MRARQRGPLLVLFLACGGLFGCPSGQPKIVEPAPTASPGPSANVFLYVAEATDPVLGTSGGRVAVYRLGGDGLLPGAPFKSLPVVNPRRLLKHPTLPILYVAGLNQIFAFNIAGGTLTSLCTDGSLAPPCATNPLSGANPFDMSIQQTGSGPNILYVVQAGGGQDSDQQTALAAYELDDNGGLPGNASSQAQSFFSVQFQGAAILPDVGYAWVADTGTSFLIRYLLCTENNPCPEGTADGNLPLPPASPTPVGAPTPTPTPTPTDPSPTPSPSPTEVKGFGPSRMLQLTIPPSPAPGVSPQTFLYVVARTRNRIAAYPVATATPVQTPPTPTGSPQQLPGDLPKDPTSESNTRGIYNALLVDPAATHIYGAAFNDGQIDFYNLNPDGNIDDQTQGSTFADTSTYPTGLAWAQYVIPGGVTQQTVFVSLGGVNRVDAYAVCPSPLSDCTGLPAGSLPARPFSSTIAIDGTFPADILAYTP